MTGASEKARVTSNAKKDLMPRRSSKKGADPARATATLLYAIRIIKPGRPALSIVQKPIFFRRLAATKISNARVVKA
jgi:hypothetical protein